MPSSRSQPERGLGRALVVSILVHVGALVVVPPYLAPRSLLDWTAPAQEEATTEEPERMRVEVVPEPEPDRSEPERDPEDRAREEPREEPEPPEEPEEEQKEEKEREKENEQTETPKLQSYNRKAVVQQTNEESPEEADFVSEKANKVEKETRARETVQKFTKPSESKAEREKQQSESTEKTSEKKLGSKVVASRARERSRPPPRPSEPRERKKKRREREKPKHEKGEGPEVPERTEDATDQREQDARPDRPPMPTVDEYSKIFDESEDRRRRKERREKGVGSDMYREIEKSEGSVQATLENYIPEVQPGNHTSVNAEADVAATYINRIHSKIHPRWGGTYLPKLDRRYGPGHPLSNPNLNAVLEIVVDGSSGELEEVTIASSSGITSYDMEAVTIAKQVAPHPKPPDALVSSDGNVYLHWNFWRDQRQCGTFGVSLYKLTEDGTRKRKERESGG